MEWSVRIETVSPDDELGVGYKSAYDRFLSVLADFEAEGGISEGGWDVQVTFEALDVDEALEMGKAVIFRPQRTRACRCGR